MSLESSYILFLEKTQNISDQLGDPHSRMTATSGALHDPKTQSEQIHHYEILWSNRCSRRLSQLRIQEGRSRQSYLKLHPGMNSLKELSPELSASFLIY